MAQRTTEQAAAMIAKSFVDDCFTSKDAIKEMMELKDDDGVRIYRAPFIIKVLRNMEGMG